MGQRNARNFISSSSAIMRRTSQRFIGSLRPLLSQAKVNVMYHGLMYHSCGRKRRRPTSIFSAAQEIYDASGIRRRGIARSMIATVPLLLFRRCFLQAIAQPFGGIPRVIADVGIMIPGDRVNC